MGTLRAGKGDIVWGGGITACRELLVATHIKEVENTTAKQHAKYHGAGVCSPAPSSGDTAIRGIGLCNSNPNRKRRQRHD